MRHLGVAGRRKSSRLVALVVLGLVVLAACSSRGGKDGGDDGSSSTIKGAQTIGIVGNDFTFEPARLVVDSRAFNVAFTSQDIFHTFVIEGVDGDEVVASARAGATDGGGVEREPGDYTFYCDEAAERRYELRDRGAPSDPASVW